tara:strand:- start:4724 stop:5875 length:1152 start_codon:yes stop_codon:yes gene_type:complete
MQINYGKHYIDSEDIKSVKKQLKSSNLTQGKTVQKFEKELKNKFRAKYCVATSSGTGSLHLISLAYGWKKNDIIFTSPLSFVATSNCILYSGAKPVFIDIDPKTHNIDINLLEKKIISLKKSKKKMKAIIAVDYAGHPNDWKSLHKIKKKYGLKLINDNCHALGASYYTKYYAAKYADCINLSFHAVKNITTGEGGAILTNDKSLFKYASLLKTHGIQKFNKENKAMWFYDMKHLGFNYRITDIQCALGISQLKKLTKFINKRRKIARTYNEAFKDDPRFILPIEKKNIKHAYHLYPLQIKFENLKISKINFFKKMLKQNIRLQVHYIPIHLHSYYKKKFGYKVGDFPICENFYKREVSLPIYYSLKTSQQNKIINFIKKFSK